MTINGPGFVKDPTVHSRTSVCHLLRCFSPKRNPHLRALCNRYYLLSRSLLSSLCNQPRSYLPSFPILFPFSSLSSSFAKLNRLRTCGASYNPILDQPIERLRMVRLQQDHCNTQEFNLNTKVLYRTT